MKMYKLLTQEKKSHGGFQWGMNKEYRIDKPGKELCSDQVFHCYSHPILAVLLNPIHANINNPRLFEIEVDAIINDDGLKFGTKMQKLVREIEIPKLDIMTKVDFSIRVAMEVYQEDWFTTWAENFLNRIDVSEAAAWAAEAAAWAAEAAWAARAAAWAAEAAVGAARAAAWAARAAEAARAAAWAAEAAWAARAAEAAAEAARAAAWAAWAAVGADMNPILEKVLKDMNLWELN